MRAVFHPEFPKEIKAFESQYGEVSERLRLRFRAEVNQAIIQIKEQPSSAGHFLNTGSKIVKEVRRRNLVSFPFFILYGVNDDLLVFRSVIPTASDPLTWIQRLTD
jgi:hypothetical protein